MVTKEKVFYQSGNIIVTSTRLSVPSGSFALTAVSSARRTSTRGALTPSVIVFVFGLLFAAAGWAGKNDASSAFGLMLIGTAGWMFIRRKLEHQLVLVMGAKETRAFSDPNPRLIESMISAVNEAIEFQSSRRPAPMAVRSAAKSHVADRNRRLSRPPIASRADHPRQHR